MIEVRNLLQVTDRVIKDYDDSLAELQSLEKEIEQNQQELKKLKEEMDLFEEVRVFLQELAEIARAEVAAGLEQIVTLCLQGIFGPDLKLEIDIETERNTTSVRFFVVDTSGEDVVRFEPEDTMGGGVVDTVAIGLRFGLLKILDPAPIGPIILDEPAKMVSGDLIDSIATLLQELTNMFDKQCILVTHHTSLMDVVDNAIHFEKINGVSEITSSV